MSSGLMSSGLILILSLKLKNGDMCLSLSLCLMEVTQNPVNMSPLWRNKLFTSGNKDKLIQLCILKEITRLSTPCSGQIWQHTLLTCSFGLHCERHLPPLVEVFYSRWSLSR